MKKNRVTCSICYLLIFIFVLLLGSGCGSGDGQAVKAPGVVDADIITLKSQVAGIIEQFDLAEGAAVDKGTVIARIAGAKVENQVKELEISLKEIEINRAKLQKQSILAKANLDYLDKQVKRFRRLEENRSLAGEKVENMELKLLEARTGAFELARNLEALDVQQEKLRNKKEYLELVLADHTIQSPTTGVLLEKFVSAGENVFPNSAVADILDISSLYVEAFIEEAEVSRLQLDGPVVIQVDGLEEKAISGKIVLFGKKAEFSPKYIISEKERKALLYRVKISITGGIEYMKVGMPVTVIFK